MGRGGVDTKKKRERVAISADDTTEKSETKTNNAKTTLASQKPAKKVVEQHKKTLEKKANEKKHVEKDESDDDHEYNVEEDDDDSWGNLDLSAGADSDDEEGDGSDVDSSTDEEEEFTELDQDAMRRFREEALKKEGDDSDSEDLGDEDDEDDIYVSDYGSDVEDWDPSAQHSNSGASSDDEVNDNGKQQQKDKKETKQPRSRKDTPLLLRDIDTDDDSSEDENLKNTIGNVPLWWYDDFDHIGYDKDGNKIMRKTQGDTLDELLARHDDPNYIRTVYDKLNDATHVLTNEEIELLERIQNNKYPDKNINPYEDAVDWMKWDGRMPLTGAMKPKKAFTASKWEHKMVVKLWRRLKAGRGGKPDKKPKAPEVYLMWDKDGKLIGNKVQSRGLLAPPKPTLPGHLMSYNPPPEYVPKNQQRYGALRHVPAYDKFVQERFERCLDLYLCPRVQIKKRKNIDPESLLPKLPNPEELRPFPSMQAVLYSGHTDMVRTISVDPTGQWLASGSDDNTVRLWEVETGRCYRIWQFDDPVQCLEWNPNPQVNILAVAVFNVVYLIQPPNISNEEINARTTTIFETAAPNMPSITTTTTTTEGDDQQEQQDNDADDDGNGKGVVKWHVTCRRPTSATYASDKEHGIQVRIVHEKKVTHLTWHSKGDYFATLSPDSFKKGVVVHQLSKKHSQAPFSKTFGKVQKLMFHPSKPLFFMVTQYTVRVYDLLHQRLVKKFRGETKFISSIAIHPGGDNFIVGGYDKKVEWFDMDLTMKPFRTMRFHKLAVRSVSFHNNYPLFASSSDEGIVHVFHGTVYDDWNKDPLIVPVKILRGHKITNDLGVLSIIFHPQQPWLFSAGADSTIRLFI